MMKSNFSSVNICDFSVFRFYHKNFVDYCINHFNGGTFDIVFRPGKNAVALFRHAGGVLSESDYKAKP